VRPKADDSHKKGLKQHASRYQHAEWGSEMGRFVKVRPNEKKTPYLFQE
jgi:hypothetical protein